MGTRTRIAKPECTITKARKIVRELYYDLLGPLSIAECDKIIDARIDGLGDMIIVSLITQKRNGTIAFREEQSRLYLQRKSQDQ